MKKFILFFSLILTVILTAGTGYPVSAANPAGTDSISNTDEGQMSQQVEPVRIDVKSLIQEKEQMQSDINDIRSKQSKYNTVVGTLAVLLIAVLASLYVMNKKIGKQLKNSESNNNRIKKRIDAELEAMNSTISNQRAIIENLSDEIRRLKSNLTTGIQTSIKEPRIVTMAPKKKVDEVVIPTEPARRPSKVKKYAMFSQDATGNMSILGRSLSDSPEGAWFEIEFAEGDTSATYTINNSCKGEILADLSMLKRFVQDLTITGKPKDIKVQKPGTLVKDGNSWKIDKKLQIQLI